MNYVVLSPHFPPNYAAFSINLRRLGANVLGLGDVPYESMPAELRGALAEYYRVSDLHRYDELVRGLGHFTHRYGKLDRFESQNEYWLETDARLREDFNINGLRPAGLEPMKRKSAMKCVFQKNGVPAARGRVCRSLDEGRVLAAETGYPLVAKPDIGVGANATYKLHSDAELESFFLRKAHVDYILEEFIQGDLFSFDGLVDQAGKLVFCSSMYFSLGIMETVNEGLDIYYYTLREIPPELEAYGRKLVRAYRLRERFFHFEFFRTAEGKFVVLEVNMRPPGGLSTDMWNYANDIDIYAEYAGVVMHNRFTAEVKRPYHCAYVARRNGRAYSLTHEQVLAAFPGKVVGHQPMSGVFAPALGDYGYLVRSPDLGEVQEIIGKIHRRP